MFAVDYLTYGSADFSFAPYGPYWKFMKKICVSELLGGRILDQFLPVRHEEIRRFLHLMLKKANAGTDTSAITTEWALAELINHPDIMKKAREEIDSGIGKSRLVEESDIPKLPYLQAIVKETLRLHPTGPLIVRESTENCSINGYEIPARTLLFVNVWALGRDPNHWENPLEFWPESGRRGCPGTSLALQVVQTSLAAMIQCFEWKVNGEDGTVDMDEGPGLTLPRANPLICVPVARLNPFPSF
ncbi:hypothetical protein GH714_032069 [Hevea brasiliensis]|uniref:Cytochrome P450 n=1 Tax=Hevea brasiliensis TaxID=3981 RepID=A0A6A6M4S0_HEVBR|nr:hypothetical protein GH714_032069 [Hevea brasiliensis]